MSIAQGMSHSIKPSSPRTLKRLQRVKVHRERIASVPEKLPRNVRAQTDMRARAIRQKSLRRFNKLRVPKAKYDTRRKLRLPIRLRRDNLVHEREKPRRVIEDLDVDVEEGMTVFILIPKNLNSGMFDILAKRYDPPS